MDQKLQFRRQFLLTRRPVVDLADWQVLEMGDYYLYVHPDLQVHALSDSKKCLVLIGNLYDPTTPEKANREILEDIFERAESLETCITSVKRYAGSYVLAYKDGKGAAVLTDPLAWRELYYCTRENQVVCGSQPNILAAFANPKLASTSDPDFVEFCKNQFKGPWDSKWIGDETWYETIKHVLPNHYFDINAGKAIRYWPNEAVKRLTLEEAVSQSCVFLQGIMKSLVHRHSVMMAVTAGTDSRTLLAASREVKHKIYYFINDEDLGSDHPDIKVPVQIFENIGVPFHVHEVPKDVDDEFRKVFLSNTFFASERLLPTTYNVYFKNHGERINIKGVGEIGRTRFGNEPRRLNSYRMAYKLGYKEGRYVFRQCDKLLQDIRPVARKSGINALTLLYWEQMLGNWGAVATSECAIAIEEVNPYNSHFLFEIFLGLDARYTNYKHNVFFREMIRRMWPELLNWPINPPHTTWNRVAWFFANIGIFEQLKELRYQVSYLRYRCKGRMARIALH